MNLCDAVGSLSPGPKLTVTLHSLVEVEYEVVVGEAVVEPMRRKWVKVERGPLRGDVVWEQLVGTPLEGCFDIALPAVNSKRLKLDLSGVPPRSNAASTPLRVRGKVTQVLQPQFEVASSTMSDAEREMEEAGGIL